MHIRVLLEPLPKLPALPEPAAADASSPKLSTTGSSPRIARCLKSPPPPCATCRACSESVQLPEGDPSAVLLKDQILSRVRYLERGRPRLPHPRPAHPHALRAARSSASISPPAWAPRWSTRSSSWTSPGVGLHPRDTAQLVKIMHALRDKGNTLVVVEHEEAIIRSADHLVDIGPGRGRDGGKLMFNGPAAEIKDSLTGQYLSGKKSIPIPAEAPQAGELPQASRHPAPQPAEHRCGDSPDVFCCVTGVSGSGKSSLIHDVLYRNLVGEAPDEHDAPGLLPIHQG